MHQHTKNDKSGSPFGEPPLRWRGEGSIAMIILMCAAVAGTSGTVSGAGLAVGTADALDTFLLFLLDVKTRTAKDQNYNCNNKEVLHRQNHFFSAYSAAKD